MNTFPTFSSCDLKNVAGKLSEKNILQNYFITIITLSVQDGLILHIEMRLINISNARDLFGAIKFL